MKHPKPAMNFSRRRLVLTAVLSAAIVCIGVIVGLGLKSKVEIPSADTNVPAALDDMSAQAASLDPAAVMAETPASAADSPYAAGPIEDARVIEDETVRGEIIISADEPGAVPGEGSVLAGTTVTGVETLSEDDGSVIAKIELADGDQRDAAMEEIERAGAVAQPNFIYRLMDAVEDETTSQSVSTPPNNDPSADRQYSYLPWIDGTNKELENAKMGSDVYSAWSLFRSEGRVTVAVIDTGCQYKHPDLAANIDTRHMVDVYRNFAPGNMWDYAGHGTHVCGIVGAEADNGIGVAGASYNAKVLPIKVFNDSTANPGASTSDIIKAYDYLDKLVDEQEVTNLRVVNMSLGGYGRSEADDILETKIKALRDEHGVLTVCSGGNGDSRTNTPYTDPMYPSDYKCVLSVTSLAPNGDDSPWSDYNEDKDISAPGEDILSTYLNSYTPLSGTSMASPLVAGVAGLLFSADPNLTPDDVAYILTHSVNPMRMTQAHGKRIAEHLGVEGAVQTGSTGALNAEAALRYVLENRLHVEEYITAEDVTLVDGYSFPYDNVGRKAREPEVKVVHEGVELVQDKDYTIRYVNNVRPGTASVIVEGILPKYAGCVNVNFEITIDESNRTDISGLTFAGVPESGVTYNGGAHTPAITITDADNYELVENLDYTIAYTDNVKAGMAHIKIVGISVYKGEEELTFEIHKATGYIHLDVTTLNTREDMAAQEIHIFGPNAMDYTAKSSQSDVADASIRHDWMNWSKYYENAVIITPKSKGETEITLTGSSPNYEEMNTATFKVIVAGKDEGIVAGTQDIANATIDVDSAGLVYDGTPHMAKITVSSGGEILEAGTHYHASYANYTNAGEATIYVSGNSYYGWSGMARKTYTIAKAVPQPSLSQSSIVFPAGANYPETVKVSAAQIGMEQPTFASATSSSDEVCTAELRDGTVIITPHGAGAATVSVKTAETPNLAVGEGVISVRVGEAEVEPPKPANPKPSTLSVSPSALTLKMGETGTFLVSGETGTLTVANQTPSVVGMSLSGDSKTITVTPKSEGRATILVACAATSEYSAGSVSATVTVNPAESGNGGGGSTGGGGGGGGGGSTGPTVKVNGEYYYTGSQIKPTDITVVYKKKELQAGVDYTIEYGENVNAGKGSVKIVGAGEYAGKFKKTQTFTILKAIAELSPSALSVSPDASGSVSLKYAAEPVTFKVTPEGVVDVAYDKASQTLTVTPKASEGAATITVTTGGDSNHDPSTLTLEVAIAEEQQEEPPVVEPTGDVPIYRLFNTTNGEHLYTTQMSEVNHLRNQAWSFEGVKLYGPKAGEGVPLYRLFNVENGEHLYTCDMNEKNTLIASHEWLADNNDQPLFYVFDKDGEQPEGTKPVVRLFNIKEPAQGAHLWTQDDNEVRVLTTQRGWTNEGAKFYAFPGDE